MQLSDAECTTITQMLLSGVRLDGRSLKEYREISFRFPSGHPCGGCCIVNIGSTSVLAKVSAEVVEPKHYRPAQGVVFVNFDATLVSFLEGLYWLRCPKQILNTSLVFPLKALFITLDI